MLNYKNFWDKGIVEDINSNFWDKGDIRDITTDDEQAFNSIKEKIINSVGNQNLEQIPNLIQQKESVVQPQVKVFENTVPDYDMPQVNNYIDNNSLSGNVPTPLNQVPEYSQQINQAKNITQNTVPVQQPVTLQENNSLTGSSVAPILSANIGKEPEVMQVDNPDLLLAKPSNTGTLTFNLSATKNVLTDSAIQQLNGAEKKEFATRAITEIVKNKITPQIQNDDLYNPSLESNVKQDVLDSQSLAEKNYYLDNGLNLLEEQPKTYNLLPHTLIPVTDTFSGVGQVLANVLPSLMSGNYNHDLKGLVRDVKEQFKYGFGLAEEMRKGENFNEYKFVDMTMDIASILAILEATGGKALEPMLKTYGADKWTSLLKTYATGQIYGTLDSLKEKGFTKDLLVDGSRTGAEFVAFDGALKMVGKLADKWLPVIVQRLNPANYEQVIKSVPKERGMGLSRRTIYEPRVSYEYKPTQNLGKNINPIKNVRDNTKGQIGSKNNELQVWKPNFVLAGNGTLNVNASAVINQGGSTRELLVDKSKLPTVDYYNNPQTDFEMPNISDEILTNLNKKQKPLVLKKNIIEKNKKNHPELSVNEYNNILENAVYNPDYILQTKPNTKPNYYSFIKKDITNNKLSVIELSDKKKSYEIVNFFKVDEKRFNEYLKRAEHEGGEVLITEKDNFQGAARLSALESDSNNIITDNVDNFNGSDEIAEEKAKTTENKSENAKIKENALKYEDYGEKIKGAKKDLWQDYSHKLSAKISSDADNVRLSDAFPEPNYDKLLKNGVDEKLLSTIKAIRDNIPPKPRSKWMVSAKNDWVKMVNLYRQFAADLVEGNLTLENFDNLIQNGRYSKIKDTIDMYRAIGFPNNKHLKDYSIEFSPGFMLKDEKQLDKPTPLYALYKKTGKRTRHFINSFETKEEAFNCLKKELENSVNTFKTSSVRNVKFDIWKWHDGKAVNGWCIGKKVGTGKYLDIKTGFKTSHEAREYLNQNKEELIDILEEMKQEPITRGKSNRDRIGEIYRDRNITPEQLSKTFGFRGVQFGNYVENSKRISDINNCYDAMCDLANILNLPKEALSLNGELGIAFGARGKGGKNPANAHYEPVQIVINLTKKNGAGSLAHEWWHALDNYFGKLNDSKFETETYSKRTDNIRQEMYDAFQNIRNVVQDVLYERSKNIDKTRTKDYWSQNKEMTARCFEKYIIEKAKSKGITNDYLANVLESGDSEKSPYPLKSEMAKISKAYDVFFKTIKTKKTDKGTALYSINKNRSSNSNALTNKDIEQIIKSGKTIGDMVNSSPIINAIKDIVTGFEDYTIAPMSDKEKGNDVQGAHYSNSKLITINIESIGDKYEAVETLAHELKHANQEKEYQEIVYKRNLSNDNIKSLIKIAENELYKKDSVPTSLITKLYKKKLQKTKGVTADELDKLVNYHKCNIVNSKLSECYNVNPELIDKLYNETITITDKKEIKRYIIENYERKSYNIFADYIRALNDYKNATNEIEAKIFGKSIRKKLEGEDYERHFAETMGYSEGIRTIGQVRTGYGGISSKSQKSTGTVDSAREGKTQFATKKKLTDAQRGIADDSVNSEIKTNDIQNTKIRKSVDTIRKHHGDDTADSITNKEYIQRGHNTVIDELSKMSPEELLKLLDSDSSSDLKTAALAQSIKADIKNGDIPIYKLNKYVAEGTDIAQALQERTNIAPDSLESAVIKMHNLNSKAKPKQVREQANKLYNKAEAIVNELQADNQNVEAEFNQWLNNQDKKIKKQYSQKGDKIALLKAMERFRQRQIDKANKEETKANNKFQKDALKKQQELLKEELNAIKKLQQETERKRKVVEKLVNKQTYGLNKRKRNDLIDNILKLSDNDGLTPNNVCKLINKMLGIKNISDVDISALKLLEENIKKAETPREKEIAKAFMNKYIVDNSIGSSITDKLKAIVHINLLGSTRARFRDTLATSLFQIMKLADEGVVIGIDKISQMMFNSERIAKGIHLKAWANGLIQGAKEGFFDTKHGINTGRAGEKARYDLNTPNAFKYKNLDNIKGFKKALQVGTNVISVLEKFVTGMIKIPDRAFFQAKYNSSLMSMLEAENNANIKDIKNTNQLSYELSKLATSEMIEQAVNEARESVFQRDCILATFSKNIRSAMNGVIPNLHIGDFALPYLHTASVVSSEILDRIGLGYIKGLKQLADIHNNGGTKAQKREAFNNIAKGIIGSIIIATTAIVGDKLKDLFDINNDDDYENKQVNNLHQKSIRIGNISIDARDLGFFTTLVQLGCLRHQDDKFKKALNIIWDSFAYNNPVISKYKESIKFGIHNSKNNDPNAIVNSLKDIISTPVSMFTQNALLRDIRDFTDPYQRETYNPNSFMDTSKNKFINAIPLASKSLPIKYNAIGKPVMKNNGVNKLDRGLSAFLTGHKHYTPDELTKQTDVFYLQIKDSNISGKNSVPFHNIKRTINVNGEKYKMNNKEYSVFQHHYGRINYNIKKAVINNPEYSSLSVQEKVKISTNIRQSTEEAVKITVLGHTPTTKKNGDYKLKPYTVDILNSYDELIK